MSSRRTCGQRLLLMFLLLTELATACSPGRGGGRRRSLRKLTPLVFKQHIPNVSENTVRASGLSEGKISRDDPRFKDLVPNYNSDIIFKDEEGTGEDRFMTQRCKETLNTLAISVMNQWPGVKLRVTEGWGNDKHHAVNSLHYEGRAVDITTSDRDRSKYGMLARLAAEAGFDWVYYESRAHIHCSVKSESSQAARSGGCFHGSSTVLTTSGRIPVSELKSGDRVLVTNPDGSLAYSRVIMFLDRDKGATKLFHHVRTESGARITLTPSHLIFVARSPNETTMTATFVADVDVGDYVSVVSDLVKEVDTRWRSSRRERVVSVEAEIMTGVYAPLTSTGTVVVDDVAASCYAVINSQRLAHWAFAPVRLFLNLKELFRDTLSNMNFVRTSRILTKRRTADGGGSGLQGVHWYAKLLYGISHNFLPSSLLYGQ